MRSPAILLAASLLLLPSAAPAGTPLGGLTVAVSPDGKRLVTGGDTRTLVVLDPETLEVKDRVWIETTIVRLAFNQKGTVLAVESSDGKLMLSDTATWKKKVDLGKRENFAVATKGDVLAGWDADYNGSTIHLHSMTDGAVKAKFPFAKGLRIAAYGLNDAGTRLAVLLEGKDDPEEKKVEYKDIPKDLQGPAREDFVQRNDGKTAMFYLTDTASGKVLCEKKVFYTTNATSIWFQGEDALVINYSNVNARITPTGEVTLFPLPNSYNYGYGASADQGLFLSGGLRDFSVTTAASLQGVKGQIDSLPGWPEYFKGFSAATGGAAIYGATTGYRVARIGTDGKVIKVVPIK